MEVFVQILSCCFLRQEILLHFVSLDPGDTLLGGDLLWTSIILLSSKLGKAGGGGGKSHQHKLWPDGPLEFIRVPCLIWIVSF